MVLEIWCMASTDFGGAIRRHGDALGSRRIGDGRERERSGDESDARCKKDHDVTCRCMDSNVQRRDQSFRDSDVGNKNPQVTRTG